MSFISVAYDVNIYVLLIYLLTAFGLTIGVSSTVHIYTKTIHRTTQLTTLVGKLSGIRTQSGYTKINFELTAYIRIYGCIIYTGLLCKYITHAQL